MLVAHGSHTDARSSRPVLDHADRLRDRGHFDEVRTAFWKGQSPLRAALSAVGSAAATVVPMMTSEGYFVEEVFPRELRLGERPPGGPETVRYADPVGTHPAVTGVVERRARAACAAPERAALAVVGHGTDRNPTSGASAKEHARRLRRRGSFAEVGALYIDEEPHVGGLRDHFSAPECVVVPLFVADAGHVTEDIPAAVDDTGESTRVRYAGAVGTAPSMANLVVARAVEAGAEVVGAEADGGTSSDAPDSTPHHVELQRWVERADALPARARRAALDEGLTRRWGELLVTATVEPAGDQSGADPHVDAITPAVERRYEVRHVADAGTAVGRLTRLPGPRALRDRARFDADGRYRPLRSERTLPDGWVLPDLDGPELAAALDHAYPSSVADWAAGRAGDLAVTHFRATAERQSGRYEPLTDLSAEDVGCAAAACCSNCVRERRWGLAPDEPIPGVDGGDGATGGTIPCREPCPVVLAAAREFALLERGEDPDGELGHAGDRYRARYLRARRSRSGSDAADEERPNPSEESNGLEESQRANPAEGRA